MLPSWFNIMNMSTRLVYQVKKYDGRALQGAELHLLADRVGRRCDRTYAMEKTLVMQRAEVFQQPCVLVNASERNCKLCVGRHRVSLSASDFESDTRKHRK